MQPTQKYIRALGMSRRLANHSGTGWSLRARRWLPCSRLPRDERLSSLFTACAPVPPPWLVPTRPAAYSSCAWRRRKPCQSHADNPNQTSRPHTAPAHGSPLVRALLTTQSGPQQPTQSPWSIAGALPASRRALRHHTGMYQHGQLAHPSLHGTQRLAHYVSSSTQSWARTQKSARPKSMTRKRFNLRQRPWLVGMATA